MKYIKDRFDELPASLRRRGAHRAPRTVASKLGAWLLAFVLFLLLVGIGIGLMYLINGQVHFGGEPAASTSQSPSAPASASDTPTPTPTPTVDPNAIVNVLNGEGSGGLATAGGEKLTAAGFVVNNIADADNSNYTSSRIIIANEAARGAALGIQQALGLGTIVVDPELTTPGTIIVILGADSVDPLLQ